MLKLKILLILFFLVPNYNFGQDSMGYSSVKTKTDAVKIPGNWQQLNSVDDSGQTYLKNKEGIIIAIAQNPKKVYSFFKNDVSDFKNVKEFYKWDSDYRKENKFKTYKLKENSGLEYIIWKYSDDKLDNIFLFGSSKANFLNLMIYTDVWTEEEKIKFLENVYALNK